MRANRHIALLAFALTASQSYAAEDAGNLTVVDLVENSSTYHGEIVEVLGFYCEGIGWDKGRLNPGPECEDGVGIHLSTGSKERKHTFGDFVLVRGIFIDNTRPDCTGVRFLDYENDGYWGNYRIEVENVRSQ